MTKNIISLSINEDTPVTLDIASLASGNFMDMALPITDHAHQSVFVKEADKSWSQCFTLPFKAKWSNLLFSKGVFSIACLDKPGTVYTSPNGLVWR